MSQTLFRILRSNKLIQTQAVKPIINKTARSVFQTSTGALLSKPKTESLGLLKCFVIITPFMYLGGMASMTGASLLEDYDIFVPEDDDDD
ncbi:essential MCU regulator, mitochondrial-like [Ciona intestinalis]